MVLMKGENLDKKSTDEDRDSDSNKSSETSKARKSSISSGLKRRGRPPKAMSLVMELEREVEGKYHEKLIAAEKKIAELEDALYLSKKRESLLVKLIEDQDEAMLTFIHKWKAKKKNKLNLPVTGRRRGRPKKIDTR